MTKSSPTLVSFAILFDISPGVSLLGVEFLDNFSICDVAVVKMKGNEMESSPGECLIENDEETAQNSSEDKKQFSYSLKIKFHTSIFGTFKQTIAFDFGVRPLLSKVNRFEAELFS